MFDLSSFLSSIFFSFIFILLFFSFFGAFYLFLSFLFSFCLTLFPFLFFFFSPSFFLLGLATIRENWSSRSPLYEWSLRHFSFIIPFLFLSFFLHFSFSFFPFLLPPIWACQSWQLRCLLLDYGLSLPNFYPSTVANPSYKER